MNESPSCLVGMLFSVRDWRSRSLRTCLGSRPSWVKYSAEPKNLDWSVNSERASIRGLLGLSLKVIL